MVERAQQERGVGRGGGNEGQVPGVALHHVGLGIALAKNLDVAAYQLHGLHLVALGHEGGGIAARARPDVEQQHPRTQQAAQVVHGGLKLHDAVTALQAQILGVLVVVLLYVG